jgi:hypothetical protein
MNIITIKKVNAGHGWYWLNEGFRYLMQAKAAWMLSMLLVMSMSLLSIYILPVMQIVLLFVFPFVAAGLALACADIEKGQSISINHVFKAFASANKFNLFRYGLLLLIMIIFAQMLGTIGIQMLGISQDQLRSAFSAFVEGKEASLASILQSPIILKYVILTLLSMLPIIVINMWAPIILVFSRLTAFQAVKISLLAGIKNILPLMIYAIIYLLLIAVILLAYKAIVFVISSIIGANGFVSAGLYLFVFMPVLLLLVSLSYSSAYVAYKDIFLAEDNK